jgi:hypothetical protein
MPLTGRVETSRDSSLGQTAASAEGADLIKDGRIIRLGIAEKMTMLCRLFSRSVLIVVVKGYQPTRY